MALNKWQHARIDKCVINMDQGGERSDGHIMCGWDECDKQGFDTNRVQVNDAASGYEPRIMKWVFCSEKHKQFFVYSTTHYGQLPPGYKRSSI